MDLSRVRKKTKQRKNIFSEFVILFRLFDEQPTLTGEQQKRCF
jgi:hypothetical protein